ncbi:MCE family protein [Mycolicibacterium sp. P9-22]|uniref:MCE family protein n=1 Tax=Mycolicibacterium sp. P9-22 TaxID=2024613 RepID=UPI0011ECA617|nr:MCE family protein [Mycolicibacterium sp. P9-22]KAA0120655.1 MCE family protein [Mycolicibacterium sp. P9-22]
MIRWLDVRRRRTLAAVVLSSVALCGCEWRGMNSMPLWGTQGGGPASYEVRAELPDVGYLEQNSRVRAADVNVGTVTKIERQGWHALITMSLNEGVDLPANAVATLGQTSLLGSLHIELAPPTDAAPEGKLHGGSVIPLRNAGSYPTTDQTLAALSMLLNGGGLGQVQDITAAFATAFAGREQDLKGLINQIDQFTTKLNAQTGDAISATESFNALVGQFADQQPVLDKALRTIPDALQVVSEQRGHLVEAVDAFGKFSALATDTVNQTKDNLVKELNNIAPVLDSLADAGPALTRSLDVLSTFPWNKKGIDKFVRGDSANLTAIIDLTLSRIDNGLFTGTRFEGKLTQLELQWGRTIGQVPSPYTAANPLTAPYRTDQGS